MKSVVYRVVAGRPEITVEDVNISGDAELLDRYRLEIPVLMIDGRKVAKYRVSVETLTRLLEGM